MCVGNRSWAETPSLSYLDRHDHKHASIQISRKLTTNKEQEKANKQETFLLLSLFAFCSSLSMSCLFSLSSSSSAKESFSPS